MYVFVHVWEYTRARVFTHDRVYKHVHVHVVSYVSLCTRETGSSTM